MTRKPNRAASLRWARKSLFAFVRTAVWEPAVRRRARPDRPMLWMLLRAFGERRTFQFPGLFPRISSPGSGICGSLRGEGLKGLNKVVAQTQEVPLGRSEEKRRYDFERGKIMASKALGKEC